MPDPASVVREHRQHYLNRKLARSPLLHFWPGTYRLDICDLFQGIQPNLPALHAGASGVTTPDGLLRNLLEDRLEATIRGVRSTVAKKLERIRKAAEDSVHSTGQHTLYLGYPCVVIPAEGGKPKLAPIFLFAVHINVSNQNLSISRVVEKNDDGQREASDAVYNRLLSAYVEKEFPFKLAGVATRLKIRGNEISDQIREILAPWQGVKRDLDYPNVSALRREHLRKLDRTTDDAYVEDCAVIGLAEFSGQAMLDDLDKIETLLKEGVPCPDALARLIMSGRKTTGNEGVEPGTENRKWLVERSDPSQESIIWAHKVNDLVVLQGPPGTGKSQTIVNVVADAVANQLSVLVVCQKRAAIEVVHKRLETAGLGALSVLVDDVDKDRLNIVRRINDIDSEFLTNLQDGQDREDAAEAIRRYESRIDESIEALNDKHQGARYRYGDLQSLLERQELLNQDSAWTRDFRKVVEQFLNDGADRNRLDDFISETTEIDNEVKRLRYGENTWSDAHTSLESDPQCVLDLLQHAKTAHDLGRRFAGGEISIHHHFDSRWFVDHPLLIGDAPIHVESLLSSPMARDNYDDYRRWLTAIRKIAECNPIIDEEALSIAIAKGILDIDLLELVERDSRDLRGIVSLRSRIRGNAIWSVADKALIQKRGDWKRQIAGAALHAWRRWLIENRVRGLGDAPQLPDLIRRLSLNLGRKRKLDVACILSGYQTRVGARNDLKDRNLLRLRGRQGIPKTSLRQLYSRGLKAIRSIAPVLLVSPETASSMLPLEPGLFDIVVIDEASQMFVAEAIPILFRGKQAVVAGDQQQMPPSDFFAYADDDEDDQMGDEDHGQPEGFVAAQGVYRLLEAAEDALPAGSHSRLSLQVHYRSSRKELIEFSNHAFYEGKLIVPSGNAPLPSFMRTAIEFEQMEGSFGRGVNDLEGKRIVELVRDILNRPEKARPSMGVIVANTRQRDHVLELIEEESERNESFRRAIERERSRTEQGEDISFFVRSVEHVQGDERDLIIFALTYAGSKRTFGPLNDKEDGRKRLNVAVTRAKRGMIVLCSLNVDHISNVAERGVQERYFVWQYLRYARAVASHDRKLVSQILDELNEARTSRRANEANVESPFEEDVMSFIESLGYGVDAQVGESGFRIDLGVRLHEDNDSYLCGIECDGARYHSGWRARTNDVWRQEILESKGWKILRIWSTDWYDKAKESRERLGRELGLLQQSARADKPEETRQFIRRPVFTTERGAPSTNHETADVPSDPTTAEEIGATARNDRRIDIGNGVKYKFLDSGKIGYVKIVRGQSAPTEGTINFATPLARALLDAEIGDEVSFVAPSGAMRLLILSIE